MKLTNNQRQSLQWLANKPWISPWWGGGPHSGWPQQMKGPTANSLLKKGFIRFDHHQKFDVAVTITDLGRKALES